MLDQWDGRSLRTFLTVMEEKNFSRAADKLGYVQSTVTTHIAQLEKASGKKLFDRLPRGVEPTEAGAALARFARQFAALSQALEEDLLRTEQPRGVLKVRALEAYCVTRLPELLASYAEHYPEVELQLSTGFMEDMCGRVLDQKVDLGIVPRDPGHEGLEFVPLAIEELVWVGATEGRGGTKQVYISYGNACLYHELGESSLREAGYALHDRRSFPSVELIKRMVQSGFGISLLPKVNVEEELRAGKLIALDFPAPEPVHQGFIHLKGKQLRPAAAAFMDWVRAGLA
ncbi:LysR family transcriptional regulator [Paenibacillus sp. JDR-2]|uniref:LysR family transcriptional regulator n=1 Tax=Paenibacillus sp. (strain JDR-2) TaxID=324057 RepID=UPI000166B1CB|nr:LysR family transcriptional regulator [Paenibacillus sp. JDR-2]ACS99270.1 transcriptional regulator, LysR family [Paenibacillus sp. JDR-2]